LEKPIQLSVDKPMRVGELAKRTGKSVRALHLYEEFGLLRPVHRSKGNFRLFSAAAVARVEWISKLQDAGLSLHDLRELLEDVSDGGVAPAAMERVRAVFAERLRSTREQIAKLSTVEKELENGLAYLDACRSCEPVHQASECGTCNYNGHHDGEQPILVAGIHKG
jgi:DNA-binding transcriptional MerR regulator